ncbi:hypothetical protein [Ornithinibacillus bavariensis]|uniref:hypothetical protein n=1 Tax=Ornithinibacillus bavariensis TaxID=545502 RepID=UPI000ED162C6|nr:hypothetical protein [Ornithinibacillus sp.]
MYQKVKERLNLKKLILIFFTILVMLSLTTITTFANSVKEIDIEISHKEALFDVSNMKPGDWAPRSITVKNVGKRDFTYTMKVQNKGIDKLFNELLLEIKDANIVIYNGKLSDFDMLPERKLYRNGEEDLAITIRFPEHLGNDYQGLGSNFSFLFIAEDITSNPGGENPEENNKEENPKNENSSEKDEEVVEGIIDSGSNSQGGSTLPSTATSLFNFLFIGVTLIITGALIILLAKQTTTNKNIKWIRK